MLNPVSRSKSRSWLAIGLVLNALCLLLSIALYKRSSYDYIGQHFPLNLPVKPSTIEKTFEDSFHFTNPNPINNEAENITSNKWLVPFPKGEGYIHLGPDSRAFYMSMWHQLHCLRVVHILLKNISKDPSLIGGEVHLQHCLNYLRQYILCNADDTLEPGDYHQGESRFTRQCADSEKIFEFHDHAESLFRD